MSNKIEIKNGPEKKREIKSETIRFEDGSKIEIRTTSLDGIIRIVNFAKFVEGEEVSSAVLNWSLNNRIFNLSKFDTIKDEQGKGHGLSLLNAINNFLGSNSFSAELVNNIDPEKNNRNFYALNCWVKKPLDSDAIMVFDKECWQNREKEILEKRHMELI